MSYIFGIDVGGTSIKCGLLSSDGQLLQSWEIPTRLDEAGRFIIPDIAESILGKMDVEGIKKEDVLGIGVGVPGPVRNGKVSVAVNLHWVDVDLVGELGELTGLPVKAGNDANMAALGEMWKGGAEGHTNVLVVTLGTGVGGGIIVEGKVIEGAHGSGGEIGHIPVDDEMDEPCNCGNCGCLEQFASASGLVRIGRETLARKPIEERSLLDTGAITAKTIFDAYNEGDPVAGRIVRRFAHFLGKGLADIAGVADPDVIVLGGGVSKAGEPLIDVVTKYYRERAFTACKSTPIVLAKLGNDAGMYGAAKLILG